MTRLKRPLALFLLCVSTLSLFTAACFAEEVSSEEEYCFSGTEFVNSLPGDFEGIYVSSVPDDEVCLVCMGSRVIRAGDFLPYSSLRELTMKPTCNENVDAQLCYQAISQGELGEETSFTMQIKSTKNDPPEAKDVTFETYKNVANRGTFHATDPEGDTLSYRLEDKPRQGTVELLENGEFLYTPKKNKVGDDSFSYAAIDEAGNVSNTATVRIKIVKPLDAQTFADLDASSQFLGMWMRESGLYGGMKMADKLCFAPDQTVSRGEFLTMAMELAGIEPEIGLVSSGFVDQDTAPHWMQPYLISAMRRGIARGVATDSGLVFRPNEPITASEAAVIVCRTFRLNQTQSVASVENSTPTWAVSAVTALQQADVMLHCTPEAVITRADAAALLYAVSKLN